MPPIIETSAHTRALLRGVYHSLNYHRPPNSYTLRVDRQENDGETADSYESTIPNCPRELDNSFRNFCQPSISQCVAGPPDQRYQGQSGADRSAQDSQASGFTYSVGALSCAQNHGIQQTDDRRGNRRPSSANNEMDREIKRTCQGLSNPAEDLNGSCVSHQWSSCTACTAKKNFLRNYIINEVLTNAMPRILEILQRELEQLDESSTVGHGPPHQDADSDTSLSEEILPLKSENISARL
ncbi:hypothetical protein B0T19DRAFT_295419 [Cercophora scortea]|uniref:Uncharacterized protein n=1 Tax=Cercophora scortea TaxID=314031 RepID=A0AAE0I3A6_9PEZI|nr:hypothetical protein B0T19DRAFT_295419 [Cercophora scortea]